MPKIKRRPSTPHGLSSQARFPNLEENLLRSVTLFVSANLAHYLVVSTAAYVLVAVPAAENRRLHMPPFFRLRDFLHPRTAESRQYLLALTESSFAVAWKEAQQH